MDSTIPKEVEDEVRAQLEPLFLDFYTGSKMYEAYYGCLEQLAERLDKATDFIRIVKRAYEDLKEPRAKTALEALTYLTQIELVGSGLIDVTILLLVAKGVDLHLEPDYEHRYTRHVTSPEDLDSPSLPLSVKLDYLKLNGLPLFAKFIDKDMRNRIAHADFEIDDDGRLFLLTKKGKKEVDMAQKLGSIHDYVTAVAKVITEQMERVRQPK